MTNAIIAAEVREKAPQGSTDRLYLPELDGLRFIAFMMVFLYHEGFSSYQLSRLIGSGASRCFRENGWVGVQLFFILSGYLITTLLLREEASFGRVDLKAFWVRRILRIWPLYYLTIVLVFGALPWWQGSFSFPSGRAAIVKHLPWFMAFLGNWSFIHVGPPPLDAQSILWSVCVEEQFYLLVPLIVALLVPKLRVWVVLLGMASSLAFRIYLAKTGAHSHAFRFGTLSQFDTLLSGVMLAIALGTDPRDSQAGRWLVWLQWPLYAVAIWVFTRSNLGQGADWRKVGDFTAIWAVGVGLVAVAVTVPGWLRGALGYSRLAWLGKISYGLYMFHEIGMFLQRRFATVVGWFPNNEILLPLLSLALTIGLAAASYYGFERRFLRLKRGWTRVPSRPF